MAFQVTQVTIGTTKALFDHARYLRTYRSGYRLSNPPILLTFCLRVHNQVVSKQ